MRPEPGNRITRAEKRRQWNESPPVCIRIASHPVKEELDARSDGTLAGYRQVARRDLMRLYQLLDNSLQPFNYISAARSAYQAYQENPHSLKPYHASAEQAAFIDACERARVLVDAGLSLDGALIRVGLVASTGN
jgi:hypothetical protein